MKVTSGSFARSSADDEVWPPGFRFHPTDEELILYYLKRKICGRKIKLDIIANTDVYQFEPEELPGLSKLKTGDRQWFFFSPRDRKYPNGARSNRGTRHGYWKATGKDRTVTCGSRDVGIKKTLVFYKGRAPNGERTDWVMHEYTLDEEELNRCESVQNYYALYKVFKKSGPGPKNGEQYGAPFKEEDWEDDKFCDFENFNVHEIPVEKPSNLTAATEEGNCQASLSLDDIEELMKKIPDDEFPEPDPCINSLSQAVGHVESGSTVVDPHSPDAIFPRSIDFSHANMQPCNVPGSFNFSESQMQSLEKPEAPAALESCEQATVLFEDFLEIDDLGGPEFLLSSTEKYESSQFGELNGLCELDQFHDAAMFLNDLGPIDFGTFPNLYQNENADDVANFSESQFQSNLDYSNLAEMNYQIPMHDHAINGSTLPELHQDLDTQQTSGLLCDPPTVAAEINQNQVDDKGITASRVSSALWAFVESIPTTPASAAENALVNRTFDRMSSFRRIISTKSTSLTVPVIDSSRPTTRTGKNRGLFVFSVLGALCAILWMFLGAIRVWGRFISL